MSIGACWVELAFRVAPRAMLAPVARVLREEEALATRWRPLLGVLDALALEHAVHGVVADRFVRSAALLVERAPRGVVLPKQGALVRLMLLVIDFAALTVCVPLTPIRSVAVFVSLGHDTKCGDFVFRLFVCLTAHVVANVVIARETAGEMPAISGETAREAAWPPRNFAADLVAIILLIGVAQVAGPSPNRRRQFLAASGDFHCVQCCRVAENLKAFKIDQT